MGKELRIEENSELIALAKECFQLTPHIPTGEPYMGNELWFGVRDNQLTQIHQNQYGINILSINNLIFISNEGSIS